MPREPKPSGQPSKAPVKFFTESGLEISLGRNGCFIGGDAMYRLTPAEAHKIGMAISRWGLGALQDDEGEPSPAGG